MNNLNYRNFDLKIWRTNDGYCAQVLSPDNGEPSGNFFQPFSDARLRNLLTSFGPQQQAAGLQALDWEAAKTLGGRLYEAVFTQDIGNSLSRSIDAATQKSERLRIRLRLTAVPELANLPWEFLYDKGTEDFLVLHYKTSIVRYLELKERLSAFAVKPPLRVLVMASSPNDYDPLNWEKELQNLQTAFNKTSNGLIKVEHLREATFSALQKHLSKGIPYHIFHFIGHGGFDSHKDKGVLVMEDENRDPDPIDGNRLGTLLRHHNSLRLILLNACQGATASSNNAFSGVAQSLVQRNIPAVIAMQFAISDKAAITFTSSFCKAVAQGSPVDAAMLDARMAVFAEQDSLEWGTPVLYLRSSDDRIFDADLRDFEASPAPLTSPLVNSPLLSESPTLKPELPPVEPKGILPLESAFYVERPADKLALDLIRYPGITLSIRAAGQMGASSLLRRVMDTAKQVGKQVVYINFQRVFDPGDFDNSEDFYRRFCAVLSHQLEKKDRVQQYWEKYKRLNMGTRCTTYMRYLLQSLGQQHLVLAMDEVDRLISSSFRSDFFDMLGNWHTDNAVHECFKRLDLVIVTSLAPNQLIDAPYQFNVDGEARLDDFSLAEIHTLSTFYNLNPASHQLESLYALIGNHPYLWQLSLYLVAKDFYTFEQLVSIAGKKEEPYNRHLSDLYEFLRDKPSLCEALKHILSNCEYNESDFLILRRTGLVNREGKRTYLRCKLYEDYFRKQLYAQYI